MHMPLSMLASFQGTAQAFQGSLTNEPLLILAALITVYIVLGVLYESYIHPITILSTLPSAGVGALLALLICGTELDVVGIIGIILLIGIVKKNGIMMVDFALEGGTPARQETAGRHLRGVPVALPSDHDDHHDRAAGRFAAGAGNRHRLGTAPSAGHHHRRRIARQPGAYPLHHAGHLPFHGPVCPKPKESPAAEAEHECRSRGNMNISSPFIHRPVATTLLTAAIALAGGVAFILLPVAPLPQIDFPTISVSASLPGGSPEVMASSVATPLERQFGRIASVTEMTSSSTLGSTSITIQFDLNRNIDGAARDVQAAINAARAYLPSNLPGNPTWRKVNPADAPIMIVALTSSIYDRGALYDAASTILMQRLSQIPGVGQVVVGGGALPGVRVEVNPTQLNSYGLGLLSVANLLSNQNANLAKGQFSDDNTTSDIAVNDQLLKAVDYRPLIVGYHNGDTVKLADVADVEDSVENLRAGGYANGKPSVLVIMFKQPQANIIDTVDRIRQTLPALKASIPSGIDFTVTMDRTTTIRASVRDVERTLLISVGLVILVVFLFLRNAQATLIPSVAVPVSLIGTFGIMYLFGYSLDNLSLMALTISTGFVVDDAIVVVENITRYLERGLSPMQAALRGAREIGFTVMAMSISLCAVFIPILLMGGIIGRLFREFAITLSVAILVSLAVSLTPPPHDVLAPLKTPPGRGPGMVLSSQREGVELDVAHV